ncbi:hypothetical protein SY83_17055 [Paenibacillus swuensis]|uniref:Uncharacterized protein n=1 Tax=Paenibacillus swuensis TaxID=1178515 RepID=A0A172TLL2_9BACL|nr:hypothetical protein [Paenibacillus swuensis]ANE47707.1 hypothetical protein SY83_17055 [Paenibacillus swuensis]
MAKAPTFIQMNTVAKYNRHDAIDDAKQIIQQSGGWVNDYKMFSNRSICLQFEIAMADALQLYPNLKQTRLIILDETRTALEQLELWLNNEMIHAERDLMGTFQITLIHDEPDLIIEVPPLEL